MMSHPSLIYLIELRQRLLKIILALCFVLIPLLFFSNKLYTLFATPLLKILPKHSAIISTQVTAPLVVPLKLSVIVSIIILMPYIFYHLWAFSKPGLYSQEKNLLKKLLISSIFLFYCGLLFCFFIVTPIALSFFVRTAPTGVQIMTDMAQYLDFILFLGFAFGLAFQVPLLMFFLIKTNLISISAMRKKRPFVIVGAFIIGMLLTPPDVISQILLAIPLWGLFELGLWYHSVSVDKLRKVHQLTSKQLKSE